MDQWSRKCFKLTASHLASQRNSYLIDRPHRRRSPDLRPECIMYISLVNSPTRRRPPPPVYHLPKRLRHWLRPGKYKTLKNARRLELKVRENPPEAAQRLRRSMASGGVSFRNDMHNIRGFFSRFTFNVKRIVYCRLKMEDCALKILNVRWRRCV